MIDLHEGEEYEYASKLTNKQLSVLDKAISELKPRFGQDAQFTLYIPLTTRRELFKKEERKENND